jgi:phosphoribosylanthranilate isomerase
MNKVSTVTRIKMCGITRIEDAMCAISLGVNALGIVLYPKSKRYLSLENAKKIRFALPPFVSFTALVVDASAEQIRTIISTLSPDMLQFHGEETDEFCSDFDVPFIKGIRVASQMQLEQGLLAYPSASGLLLDAFVPNQPGGTGQTFDWSWMPKQAPKPLILAGGLTPDNVAIAIQQTRPYAVDVSGGIEVSAGIKSADKMQAFVQAVQTSLSATGY